MSILKTILRAVRATVALILAALPRRQPKALPPCGYRDNAPDEQPREPFIVTEITLTEWALKSLEMRGEIHPLNVPPRPRPLPARPGPDPRTITE